MIEDKKMKKKANNKKVKDTNDKAEVVSQFGPDYYNEDYYVTPDGKKFETPDGETLGWSYQNPDGEFLGADDIVKAWKLVFDPKKMLDVGAGRGTFVAYAHNYDIEAVGFDFSSWAVGDKGRYPNCKADWLEQHDATKPWPYKDNQFDMVTCLDLLEHIYEEDIQFVIDEMCRVSKKYIFLQIASLPHDEGVCFKKGQKIPVQWQGCAVAGHVIIQPKKWWIKKMYRNGWKMNKNILDWFLSVMDSDVISNWLQNTIVVMEKENDK